MQRKAQVVSDAALNDKSVLQAIFRNTGLSDNLVNWVVANCMQVLIFICTSVHFAPKRRTEI